ncbi:hypothetical protein ACGC1H_003617 [Rhizoctonia solani]
MPMPVLPGSTYRASNAYVKFKRHVLRLEDPVRIEFEQEWKEGNPLYDWYNRRSSHLIKTMQLRKERNAPFFHEYVVFELEGNGGYFRIDRRQLPEETLPLDCICEHGVEAFDTIEQVISLEDDSYSASDCLTMLTSPTVQLEFVLRTVWAIHQNSHSRVYTLQRYNCYFFSQTVFLFAARSVSSDCGRLGQGRGVSGVDWCVAYPKKVCVRHLRTRLQTLPEEHHYNPDVEIPKCNSSTLPKTLRYLFYQLRKCVYDQGGHALSIVHFDSCPFCLGLLRLRPLFSRSTVTPNASDGNSNQSNRFWPPVNDLLSDFNKAVVDFWQHALVNTLAAHQEAKFEVLYAEHNSDAHQSEEELKQKAFGALDRIFETNSSATRALWSECVREALQPLSKGLVPRMQCSSACPARKSVADLISNANATMKMGRHHIPSITSTR